MERIKSFTIDHMKLLPDVYVSREDKLFSEDSDEKAYFVTTYDIRITRPNFEPVMSTAEIHAIEHLGATWLRNNDKIKERVVYWGPMGCRTGFYLIMSGTIPVEEIKEIMKELFLFISVYDGEIPGATKEECGNYSDMDLPAANERAKKYLGILNNLTN